MGALCSPRHRQPHPSSFPLVTLILSSCQTPTTARFQALNNCTVVHPMVAAVSTIDDSAKATDQRQSNAWGSRSPSHTRGRRDPCESER